MFGDGKWLGGSESAMFNRLEDISEMMRPVTPFLQVVIGQFVHFLNDCIFEDISRNSSAV